MKTIVKIIILLALLITGKLAIAQCDFYGTITVSASGFESGATYTQEYVLVSNEDGTILDINISGVFSSLTAGQYLVYAVNYRGSRPSVLAIGNAWSGVSAYDANAAYCFDALPAYNGGVVNVCDQICTGDPLSASTSGFYVGGAYSQRYVLVNSVGTILATNSSGNFSSSDYGTAGTYSIYAVNTENTAVLSSIGSGNPWSSALSTIDLNCAEEIGPYLVEVGGATCPLPLLSVLLTGTSHQHHNALNWKTTTSDEISHYVVQKSDYEGGFETVAQTETPQWTDNAPYAATCYRVVAVNKNGDQQVSNVVTLKQESRLEWLSLYPNPAHGSVNLSLQTASSQLTVSMHNALGQEVMMHQYQTEAGINHLDLDISSLADGLYYVVISDGQQAIQRRMTKIR